MNETLQSLAQYGYVLLFAFVLAEQVGLPIPAVPVLLGVGALAGAGRMSFIMALAAGLAASLPPDLVWYELGRRRGPDSSVASADSCVRRTEPCSGRRLLIAKFFPGLSTIAPPLTAWSVPRRSSSPSIAAAVLCGMALGCLQRRSRRWRRRRPRERARRRGGARRLHPAQVR
jgi:hypothetical protein